MRSREEQIIYLGARLYVGNKNLTDANCEAQRHIDEAIQRGRELERAEMGRRIEQVRYRIGGVEIDEMEGDNLAITLCSAFDGPDDEVGENGWTERATTCCDKIISLVHAQYVAAMNAENGNG
ncbi:hypothetical protein ACOZ4Y_02770 [Komagataeibacter rhaeticus]